MTEQDWLTATDPKPMLEFLRTTGRFSDRKARLFAVACCRRIWPLLTDERSRRAVEVAERYADGGVDAQELRVSHGDAGRAAEAAHWQNQAGPVQTAAEAAVPTAAVRVRHEAVLYILEAVAEAAADKAADDRWEEIWQTPGTSDNERWDAEQFIYDRAAGEEHASQVVLLRDMLPNLFYPLPVIDAAVLAWNNGAVVQLARDIYEANAWDRLAELGRMLEQAGCRNEDIIGHCREQGQVHVRGCFVLDILLGKG